MVSIRVRSARSTTEEWPAGEEYDRRGNQQPGDAEEEPIDLVTGIEGADVQGGGVHHRLHGAEASDQ